MKKKLVPLIITTLTIALVWVLIDGLNAGATVSAGDKAPEFELEDVSGKVHQLSDYKGEYVVLNFFATWCQPCIDEAPELEAFGKEYDKAELLIIAKGESKRRIENYLEESGSELPYLLDTQEKMSKQYNVIGQPETIIIDRDGVILERFSGPTTKEKLIELLEQLQNKTG